MSGSANIARESAIQIADRSIVSVSIYPLLLPIFAFSTDLASDYFLLFVGAEFCLILIAVSRYLYARDFTEKYDGAGEVVLWRLVSLMAANNTVLSSVCAFSILQYGASAESTTALLIVAASAAASLSATSPRLFVQRMVLGILLIPGLIAMVIIGEWGLAAMATLFGGYLVLEAIQNNKRWVESLDLRQQSQTFANQLESAQQQLYGFTDLLPDPVLVIRDRIIEYVNPACAVFLGREPEELIGLMGREIVHEDYYEVLTEVQARTPDNVTNQVELGYIHPEKGIVIGDTRWLVTKLDGQDVRLSSIRDMTFRHQFEAALAKSEREFRTLIEQSPDAVIVHDGQEVIYSNQSSNDLLGYSAIEMLGKPMTEIMNQSQHGTFRDRQSSMAGGEQLEPWEVQVVTNTGQLIWVEAHALKSSFGAVEDARIVVARDLTFRKEAEEALRKKDAELSQAQRLQSIGTLAGGIAHDFNNILTSIVGATQLAQRKLEDDNAAIEHLEEIMFSSTRATELVRQILLIGKQGQASHDYFELKEEIEKAVRLIRHLIPTSVEVRFNAAADSSQIYADRVQVNQILLNILTNSADAIVSRGGVGSIRIELEETRKENQSLVLLSIVDDGPGIDEETLAHVFDPFFTTKELGAGTGLGLSIVRSYVEENDGKLELTSSLGIGTTVRVSFPRTEERPEVENATRTVSKIDGLRILLVDDEKKIRDIYASLLEDEGCQVLTAVDGVEAFKMYLASPDEIDLVISDVQMPKMTGVQLVEALLKVNSDLPIILCSGFTELVDEEKAAELGVRSFVHKPLSIEKLHDAIEQTMTQDSLGAPP